MTETKEGAENAMSHTGESGARVLCAHADQNGEGAHWLGPNEVCAQEPDFSRVLGNTEDTVWDESMVREGCICGHGQYDHDFPVMEPGKCRGCECRRFVRDMRGDRCGGGCVLVWRHPGDHHFGGVAK